MNGLPNLDTIFTELKFHFITEKLWSVGLNLQNRQSSLNRESTVNCVVF